jgi:hypothetical protein
MTDQSYKTLLVKVENKTARIIFNRPDVHNAFNATMISEVSEALEQVNSDQSVRVVVLTGRDTSFCAGADINWMKEIIHYSYEQNLEESLALAEVLYKLYTLPKPTIAMVNGTAIGGGNGFLSACDIAIAAEEAKFGLSEVKIGCSHLSLRDSQNRREQSTRIFPDRQKNSSAQSPRDRFDQRGRPPRPVGRKGRGSDQSSAEFRTGGIGQLQGVDLSRAPSEPGRGQRIHCRDDCKSEGQPGRAGRHGVLPREEETRMV